MGTQPDLKMGWGPIDGSKGALWVFDCGKDVF